MGDTQDKSDVYAAFGDKDIEGYLEDLLLETENEPQCDCQEWTRIKN